MWKRACAVGGRKKKETRVFSRTESSFSAALHVHGAKSPDVGAQSTPAFYIMRKQVNRRPAAHEEES